MTRREVIAGSVFGTATALSGAQAPPNAVVVDPRPLFDFSPHFYMQFMEPLGVTDSSVEASWDYDRDDWRQDLVETTRDLAPDCIRWGGIYSRYYKWREGIGPARQRPPMRNYEWGGWETHRAGTHEFAGFCRRTGAAPLYCVNFLGDGVARHARDGRAGDAREAADWVSYANDPDHPERRKNGSPEPLNIRLWQLGNETSYGNQCFPLDQAIGHTVDFAKAMRARDRSIELIAWGDGQRGAGLWASPMLDRAGEHIDYIAIHMMGMSPVRRDTVLRGLRYQQAPETAWDELLELTAIVDKRVVELEQAIDAGSVKKPIAITEGHLSLPPRNANPILLEWLSAVYHARSLNIYHRHGARVRICTAADFAGNRWTVNAVMIQVPRGISYLTPAGSIMRLFKRHNGRQGVAVKSKPPELDIAASRTGDRLFLHVLNTSFRRALEVPLHVAGRAVSGGRVVHIAPPDPRQSVSEIEPNVFRPREDQLPANAVWRFPAASVSALELDLAPI